MILAALPSGGSRKTSKLESQVNDWSFIRDVNAKADGNFTAAASPFFNNWKMMDLKFGFGGVSISSMVGMPGAVQYCEKDSTFEGGGIPSSYDARKEWPNCFHEVYDSGNCTASYAIAAATSLSTRFCIADADKYSGLKLSPQQVLSCDKKKQRLQRRWCRLRLVLHPAARPLPGGVSALCRRERRRVQDHVRGVEETEAHLALHPFWRKRDQTRDLLAWSRRGAHAADGRLPRLQGWDLLPHRGCEGRIRPEGRDHHPRGDDHGMGAIEGHSVLAGRKLVGQRLGRGRIRADRHQRARSPDAPCRCRAP